VSCPGPRRRSRPFRIRSTITIDDALKTERDLPVHVGVGVELAALLVVEDVEELRVSLSEGEVAPCQPRAPHERRLDGVVTADR
jgi:hypothetical protein